MSVKVHRIQNLDNGTRMELFLYKSDLEIKNIRISMCR